jgi:hypothetical protein
MTYKNFSEFHATVTKQMPDVTRYPEMYNLCYDLMKKTWDASLSTKQKEMYDALDSIARWGEDNGAHWCRETARKALNGGNK